MSSKQIVAEALAKLVKDGEIIGIGSGSTVELALVEIGKRVAAENLSVRALATSVRSAQLASEAGVHVLSPFGDIQPDWAFDGADEVDTEFNMIKGRGAAMLREKIVARKSNRLVIIVTEEKLVDRLGSKFAVPVEVLPEAVNLVERELKSLGSVETVLRSGDAKYGPTTTDYGNVILDARFQSIEPSLETEIKSITGVVESGLFCGFNPELIVAASNGVWSHIKTDSGVKKEPLS